MQGFFFCLTEKEIHIGIDRHFFAWLGTIQYIGMHASVDITGKRRHTSLGAGATECSNGAHEDDESHKSSHSNADDHRHWERFCREQQRDVSFYDNILQTFQMYIKLNIGDITEKHTTAYSQNLEATFFFQAWTHKHIRTNSPHTSLFSASATIRNYGKIRYILSPSKWLTFYQCGQTLSYCPILPDYSTV